jgi:hypothetical protein
MDTDVPGEESHIDPSHEGGKYFQFIDMAQASLTR